eukprot:SAG31_NODE_1273_length_9057_cov_13.364103_2_plen_130_part_00
MSTIRRKIRGTRPPIEQALVDAVRRPELQNRGAESPMISDSSGVPMISDSSGVLHSGTAQADDSDDPKAALIGLLVEAAKAKAALDATSAAAAVLIPNLCRAVLPPQILPIHSQSSSRSQTSNRDQEVR